MASEHLKTRADAPADFFAAEAAGLAWLAAATAAGGAAVASVLRVADDHIALGRVAPVRPSRADAAAFGRRLAATHAAGAPSFGAGPPDGPGQAWIGRQSLPLGDFAGWGEFYATTRMQPYLRAAVDRGHLDPDGARMVERVQRRLVAGEFDDGRPPDRIHGDLWTGNVLWSTGGGVLIDPAAHGGAGQTDLAMLALFGAPHLEAIETAYADAAGLPADWRDRTALHQLHPLLVHAVSHGPEYGVAAVAAARRYV